MSEREVTQGEALVAIAEEDTDALKLVGDLMERNARDLARNLELLREAERRDHEETLRQLDQVSANLALIEERVAWLFGVER